MEAPHFFADVNLPFHVWVREGRSWVLRDAASRFGGESAASASRDESAKTQEPRGLR
jgi:hypothetical protein